MSESTNSIIARPPAPSLTPVGGDFNDVSCNTRHPGRGSMRPLISGQFFRTPPQKRGFTGIGALAAQWEDSNQPIGADHGPTRTVPTSVSAVASLHAGPWRLADAAPGAGCHRVTVGAACGV